MEAVEEHQHDLCIVPQNPVATTKAIDHLKAKAELVDIPPVPGQHRSSRVSKVRQFTVPRTNSDFIVIPSPKLLIDGHH